MNTPLLAWSLVLALVAALPGAQGVAPQRGKASADPDIAPPATLREMVDVSPIVIVARVVPSDSPKYDAGRGPSRGVVDSQFYTYTMHPIEILKGTGLGEKIRVRVPRISTTERWSPGDEFLLFLKRTSERGVYLATSSSAWMLMPGVFIIPELLTNSYFDGRSKIPKDELLSTLRQIMNRPAR